MSQAKFTFNVDFSGELDAGLMSYTDKVTVMVESGEVPGGPLEFIDDMLDCLRLVYDGATVRLANDENE